MDEKIRLSDEKIRLDKEREYSVVKANELVQRTRYELSLPEQKSIAYICSKIKPIEDGKRKEYQLEYEFEISEYCKLCGIDYENGKNYLDVKATLKKLSDKSMWLKISDDTETLVRWLSKVTVNKRSGLVKIRLDEDLVPYLFNLKERFTQYQLQEVLCMQSKYSIRIFELLKSYEYVKSKTFELDYLKHLLMVDNIESYNRYFNFKNKVLEPAVEEINRLTYMTVSYEPVKSGRKVTGIRFAMRYSRT